MCTASSFTPWSRARATRASNGWTTLWLHFSSRSPAASAKSTRSTPRTALNGMIKSFGNIGQTKSIMSAPCTWATNPSVPTIIPEKHTLLATRKSSFLLSREKSFVTVQTTIAMMPSVTKPFTFSTKITDSAAPIHPSGMLLYVRWLARPETMFSSMIAGSRQPTGLKRTKSSFSTRAIFQREIPIDHLPWGRGWKLTSHCGCGASNPRDHLRW